MNITKESNNMGNILDKAREREQEWQEEYNYMTGLIGRTPEEEERFYQLKVRLGYVSPVNNDIECFGCGS
jgi:hypothetical protein